LIQILTLSRLTTFGLCDGLQNETETGEINMKEHAFQGFLCLKGYSQAKIKLFITHPFLLVWMILVAALPAWAQAPSLTWSTNIGARAFALDALNNVYASTGNQIIVLNSSGVPQSTNIVCPLPGVVKRDAAGNFYYGGSFDGTQNFGGITLAGGCTFCAVGHYGPGAPSCYLAKYSSTGTLQWVTSFGVDGDYNRVTDLALNPDGTITVGYDTSGAGTIGMYSSTGSNIWTRALPGGFLGDNAALKVGSFDGTNGGFIQYTFSSYIKGGTYDGAGNVAFFTGYPPTLWVSELNTNGEPAMGVTNTIYIAGIFTDTMLPQLQSWSSSYSLVATQSIGSVEQYILGKDSGGNLYLAGTNGLFSKYDANGTLLWSTNYGTAAVALQLDGTGGGVISFSNGAVAHFGAATVSPDYQAPALVWTTASGATAFALDDQHNVYASVSNDIIVLNAGGIPQQTNSYCPLPGVVKRDSAGNFYYGGSFDGTQNFGGITLVGGCQKCGMGHYAPGWPSCYLAKYSSTGTLQWVTSFGVDGDYNRVTDLALNPDGTITVGYDTSGIGTLGMYSSTGSNIWTRALPGGFLGDNAALKVGSFDGTNGCFIQYTFSSYIKGGTYDGTGNVAFFTGYPPPLWVSSLSTNGGPAMGVTNTIYVAGIFSDTMQPALESWSSSHSLVATQSIGSVEQYILGKDSGGNLYLAGINGLFSKYDGSGNFMWSTNYGAVIVSMLLDNSGSGILSFANGSISRFGTSAESRPQLMAARSSGASGFQFTILSAPQTVFEIFTSSDLSSWNSVGRVTNSTGHFDYTDPDATGHAKKFYKAVRLQ
jgi:hypothetical protein